ncbi:M42 family metallopeptidase [Lutispora thermophila]|uniref:Putative aminopeptidase FrvX n=1 Tax=Lutispora thermophila DSM 19022 TaxID=1122184 RepID=A0A1M6CH76_9FIRM|nr:M42 family metallopeptidase [Lutispora thermophila]SHI60273.1 Putative aminopeptidase FrvX [Lutispora thermophila DSM 19022]
MNINYVISIMKKICETPSPSGWTNAAMNIVKEELESFGINTSFTNKGSLSALIPGKNPTPNKALAAHIDTLGAMVKKIKDNGRIAFTPIGGYTMSSIECENCFIHTANNSIYTGTVYSIKPSVHIHEDCKTLERNLENMEIVIDEKVSSADDVQNLGIEVGDFITFDPRFQYTNSGFIKSRHLDDKACVAILLGLCKHIMDNKITLEDSVQILITNYEEVGHGASVGLIPSIKELLCLDMGAPGTGQNSSEYSVSICAKDSGGPYDFSLRNHLVELARNNNIDYKVDIYPHYGSDAGAAIRSGFDIKFGLIGPGIYASHSYERTHKDSIANTAELALKYILSKPLNY